MAPSPDGIVVVTIPYHELVPSFYLNIIFRIKLYASQVADSVVIDVVVDRRQCGFIRNLYFLAKWMNDKLPQTCGFIRTSPNKPGWMKIFPAAVCGFIRNLYFLAEWMNNFLPQTCDFIRNLPNLQGWMKISPAAVCGFIRNLYFLAKWMKNLLPQTYNVEKERELLYEARISDNQDSGSR